MGLIEDLLGHLFPPATESVATLMRGRRATVRGRVVARDLLESPVHGVRCVYYRTLIEEWRASSVIGPIGGGGFWTVIEQDEAIAEFSIQDESGRALVAPERARVNTGAAFAPKALGGGRRAAEQVIRDGDLVEIEGLVEEVDDLLDEGLGYRAPRKAPVLRAPEGGVLRVRVVR